MGDSSLAVISSAAAAPTPSYPAIPPAVIGIHVNFCKNPACNNFGVPADLIKFRRTAGALTTTPGTA